VEVGCFHWCLIILWMGVGAVAIRAPLVPRCCHVVMSCCVRYALRSWVMLPWSGVGVAHGGVVVVSYVQWVRI